MGPFFDVSAGQNTSLTEPKEHFSYRSPFDSCLIMKNRNPIKWPTLFYSSRQSFQRFMEKVLWVLPHTHRRRIKTEANAKVVAAVWGTELDSIPCRTTDLPPGWFEEKTEWIKPTWRNGCFEKDGWSSGLHHSKPPLYQNGCSSKNFCMLTQLT